MTKKVSPKPAPKPAAKPTPTAAPAPMPRRGSPEFRQMERDAFNKRFEAQKKSRGG